MRRLLSLLLCLLTASAASAQGREVLGYGRLFNNDYLGDNSDRWRTGSYTISQVRGPGWDGARPGGFGEIVELRFRTEIIAPSSLTDPPLVDRRYAGIFSFGVYTHLERGGVEISAGADILAVGPQTGIGRFQEQVHEVIGASPPLVLDDQIEDAFYLGASGELAYPIAVNELVLLRPFVEATVGPEDMARAGIDVLLGNVGRRDLLLRDVTTGQLYRGTDTEQRGMSLVLGGDITAVGGSDYLPGDGPAALGTRYRYRAGVHWQILPETSFFYGATYLSEEFEGQPEGQLLGSLKLNFNF